MFNHVFGVKFGNLADTYGHIVIGEVYWSQTYLFSVDQTSIYGMVLVEYILYNHYYRSSGLSYTYLQQSINIESIYCTAFCR